MSLLNVGPKVISPFKEVFRYIASCVTAGLILLPLFTVCKDENISISLTGLNYTGYYIIDFTANGYSGANIGPNGGGGSFVCCVSIPNRWREDLYATVKWQDDSARPETLKERIVKVPRYADGDFGSFVVHFYQNDVVRVLVNKNRAASHLSVSSPGTAAQRT